MASSCDEENLKLNISALYVPYVPLREEKKHNDLKNQLLRQNSATVTLSPSHLLITPNAARSFTPHSFNTAFFSPLSFFSVSLSRICLTRSAVSPLSYCGTASLRCRRGHRDPVGFFLSGRKRAGAR